MTGAHTHTPDRWQILACAIGRKVGLDPPSPGPRFAARAKRVIPVDRSSCGDSPRPLLATLCSHAWLRGALSRVSDADPHTEQTRIFRVSRTAISLGTQD
jgi:hypothetical protein